MAVEEETTENAMSSMFLASWDSKKIEAALSSEELAWVDSCLTKDSEVLDSGWSSLKDALMEVISLSSQLTDSSAAEDDIQMLPPTEDLETADSGERINGTLVRFITEEKDDENPQLEDVSQAETSFQNVFLPNYREFPEETGKIDSFPFTIEVPDMEPFSKDIFKIWELDIPDEENEFSKQLTRGLIKRNIPRLIHIIQARRFRGPDKSEGLRFA